MVGQNSTNPWLHGDESIITWVRESAVSVQLSFEALTVPPREWPVRRLPHVNGETYYQVDIAAFLRLVGHV